METTCSTTRATGGGYTSTPEIVLSGGVQDYLIMYEGLTAEAPSLKPRTGTVSAARQHDLRYFDAVLPTPGAIRLVHSGSTSVHFQVQHATGCTRCAPATCTRNMHPQAHACTCTWLPTCAACNGDRTRSRSCHLYLNIQWPPLYYAPVQVSYEVVELPPPSLRPLRAGAATSTSVDVKLSGVLGQCMADASSARTATEREEAVAAFPFKEVRRQIEDERNYWQHGRRAQGMSAPSSWWANPHMDDNGMYREHNDEFMGQWPHLKCALTATLITTLTDFVQPGQPPRLPLSLPHPLALTLTIASVPSRPHSDQVRAHQGAAADGPAILAPGEHGQAAAPGGQTGGQP